jgi:serine/threonine protein phosphatase PrpC
VIELSQDHLPYNVAEWERIEKAGGFVDEKGRLNGTLAMSRAFGDVEFKSEGNLPKDEQLLVAKPDVKKIRVSEDDQ